MVSILLRILGESSFILVTINVTTQTNETFAKKDVSETPVEVGNCELRVIG